MKKKSIAIVAAAVGIGFAAAVALSIDDHNAWKRKIPYAVSELNSRASVAGENWNILLAKGRREDWLEAIMKSGEPYQLRTDLDCSTSPASKVIELQGALHGLPGGSRKASVLTASVGGETFTAYATPKDSLALWNSIHVEAPGVAWSVQPGECATPSDAGLAAKLFGLIGKPQEQFASALAALGGIGNVLRIGNVEFEVTALPGTDGTLEEVQFRSLVPDLTNGPQRFEEVMAALQQSGSHPASKSEISGTTDEGRPLLHKFWTFRSNGEALRTLHADLYYTGPSAKGNQILLEVRRSRVVK